MAGNRRRVYLWGWYGHQNSGDDALLVMMSKVVAEVGANIEAVVQVPPDAQLPSLRCPTIVKRSCGWFRGHTQLRKLGYIFGSDAVLFGGGSNMSDADATRMFYLRLRHLFCCIAQIRGIPLVFAALGLGPLTTERGLALAGRILNMAEMVEVRDNNSYELCKKLNVSSRVFRGFDPAVLIGRQISKGIVRDSSSGDNLPTIGISLSGSPGTGLWQETGGDSKIDRVADALRRLTAVRRVRAAIIEMCACEHFSDRELGEKLMARLKGICEVTLIPYCPEPAEMMRRLSGLRCIVAERLHAAIYAYALEIPFAVIADHLKCEAFTMDVGLPESCVLRKDTPVENILRTLEWLLCANPGYRPTLAVEDACEMAASGQQAVIGALKASLVRAGQK